METKNVSGENTTQEYIENSQKADALNLKEFASRLYNFAFDVMPGDMPGEEEKDYILEVALSVLPHVYERSLLIRNRCELLEEDIESVHLFLDDMGAPRKSIGGKPYSIVGRIRYLLWLNSKRENQIYRSIADAINDPYRGETKTAVEVQQEYEAALEESLKCNLCSEPPQR